MVPPQICCILQFCCKPQYLPRGRTSRDPHLGSSSVGSIDKTRPAVGEHPLIQQLALETICLPFSDAWHMHSGRRPECAVSLSQNKRLPPALLLNVSCRLGRWHRPLLLRRLIEPQSGTPGGERDPLHNDCPGCRQLIGSWNRQKNCCPGSNRETKSPMSAAHNLPLLKHPRGTRVAQMPEQWIGWEEVQVKRYQQPAVR